MKQIFCRILVVLTVIAAILGLSSCNIFIEEEPTMYDLVVNNFEREVVYGTELNISGLEIKVTTGDAVERIPVTSDMIVSGDTKTVGVHTLVVEYEGFSWSLTYEVFYKIDHIVNGMVYDSQLVTSRDEILYVSDPVKNGSIFLGWSVDLPETLTGNVRREAVFVDNITLPKLSATYGDTLADIQLPTVSGGVWSWQDDPTTSVGNAGTNEFKLVYTFDDTSKGTLTFDVDVEVAKKKVEITVLDEYFIYNGREQTIRFELSEDIPAGDIICFDDISATEIRDEKHPTEKGETYYSYKIKIFNDNYEGEYSGFYYIYPIDVTITVLLCDPKDGNYKDYVEIDYGEDFPAYRIDVIGKNGESLDLGVELILSRPILLKAELTPHLISTSFDDTHYNVTINSAYLKVNTIDMPDLEDPRTIGADNLVYGDRLSAVLFEEHQLGYWEWDLSGGDTVGNAGWNKVRAIFVPKDTSYNKYVKEVEIYVNPKPLTFDITSSLTYVYDGSAHGLTFDVVDSNSREVVNGLKVLGNNKFVNAGSHEITLTFEDTNYVAVENIFILVIRQANVNPDFSFTVNDVWWQGITLSDIPLPSEYKWNEPGKQIGEPGEYIYAVTYYPADSNYAPAVGSLILDLDKATPSLTTDSKVYSDRIFNTTEHKLSGIITHSSDSDKRNDVEYYISGTDEKITGLTNAGTYNIDIVVPESNKYKSAKVSVVVVIGKATPSINQPIIGNWAYGNVAVEPVSGSAQVTVAGFNYYYYVEELDQYIKLDGVPTNAGTYYVSAYSLENGNYYAGESEYREFVIEKCVVARPALPSCIYTGGALSAIVPASDLYKVSENGNPARFNVGQYNVTLELVDSSNYVWDNGDTLSTVVSYEIQQATVTLGAITGSSSIVFDNDLDFESEKGYANAHETDFANVVYLYATVDNPTAFTTDVPVNVGSYLVKAVVYPDDNKNWGYVETAPFRFEITKRPIAVPELSETTAVFSGGIFKPTAAENTEIYKIDYQNENSINKGEYKVTFTIIDSNYMWEDTSDVFDRTYTITAATPVIYDVVSDGWVYDNSITHSASAKIVSDNYDDYAVNVGVIYYNINNKETPINKPSNAGTYYVRFVVTADNTNGNWVSVSSDYIEFVVEQKSIDVPELADSGAYTFIGSEITLNVIENALHKAHYSVAGNVNTNVGSYTAVYSLESANYKWSDESTEDKTIDYTIVQAETSVTGLAIEGWTFNGSANAPVYVAKTATGYTIPENYISISYRKDTADNWTVTSPANWADECPQYAGTYYVKVAVIGGEGKNWIGSESAEFELVIAKDNYDMSGITWNYSQAFPFNDKDRTVSIVGTLPAGVTVESYTGNIARNAGNYTANVKFSYDSDNYNEPTVPSCEWTINKLTVVKPDANTTAFVYNGSNQEYVLPTHSGYTVTNNIHADAGNYTVLVSLNNTEDVVNYVWEDGTFASESYDFIISPKALEASFVTLTNTLVYNGEEQTQNIQVKFGDKVLTLGTDYTVTGNKQTNAGENYTMTVVGSGNFEGAVTVGYTVGRKPIGVPGVINPTYNGSTLYSGIDTVEGQWTVVDTAHAATENGTTPAGNYTVTITLNSNYKWNDGSIEPWSVDYKVEKATITLDNLTAKYPEGKTEWTFEDAIAYEATKDKTFGEIKYLYSKTLNGQYVEENDFNFDEATSYYVKAEIYETRDWNSASTNPVHFVINQKPVAIPTVSGTYVYESGVTHNLALNNFDSKIMSFADDSVISTNVAGSYVAKVALNSNYKWSEEFDGVIGWSVSKAPASITVTTARFEVNFRESGYTIGDIVSGIIPSHSEVAPDYSIKSFGDAKTYVVIVSLAESDNYFAADDKEITIVINPIDTPDVITGLVATYGDTLSSVSLESYNKYGTWTWDEAEGALVGNAGTAYFTAKFVPYENESGGANYKATSVELSISVGQKTIFVPYMNANQTFTYKFGESDKSITPLITVPELVAGDLAANVYRIDGLTNSAATTHTVKITLLNSNYKWGDDLDGDVRTFEYKIDPYKISVPNVEDKEYKDGADISSGLKPVAGTYKVISDEIGTVAGTSLKVVLQLEDANTVWVSDKTNVEIVGDVATITYRIISVNNEWVIEPSIDGEMVYGTATVTRPTVLHGGVRVEYKLNDDSVTQWIEIPEDENLPANLDVNNYLIRFTSTDESASTLQVTIPFAITPAPATITVTNGLGIGGKYNYNGYDLSLITAKAYAGGVEIDGVEIYLNGEKATLSKVYNAAEYVVVFKLNNKNYSASEESVTVTITKADENVPTIDNMPYMEVTENQKPTVTLDFDESLVTVTNVGGINVGKYSVTIKFTEEAYKNHQWNAYNLPENATINGDTVTIEYEITKVENSFVYAEGHTSLTIAGWRYDDTANAPVGIAGSSYGKVEYKYFVKNSEGEYVPTTSVTKAGEYQVVAYVTANGDNYDYIETAPVDFAIAVRTITPPTFKLDLPAGQNNFVFADGVTQKPTLVAEGDSKYYTYSNAGNVKAGSYSIEITIKEEHKDSVVWADGASTVFDYVIEKAPVNEPGLTNGTVYTGSAIYGTYAPSNLYSEITADRVGATNAGEIGSITLKLNDTDNYRWASDLEGESETTVLSFTVTPKPVAKPQVVYKDASGNVVSSFVYNDGEYTITVNGVGDYMAADEANVYTATDAYTYTLKYTLDSNHKWNDGDESDSVTITWTISKDTTNKVTVTPTDKTEWTYGDAISYSASHKYGTLTVVYINKATGEEAEFENGTLPAGTYIAIATLEDHNNYNGSEGSVEFTVSMADSKIGDVDMDDWSGANVNLTFGAESNPTAAPELPKVTANGVAVSTESITIYWASYSAVAVISDEVTDPYAGLTWYEWTETCYPKDAGSYIVKVEVAESEGRYNASVKYLADAPIVIAPAEMAVPTVSNKVFNLGAQSSGIVTEDGKWIVVDGAVEATVEGVTPADTYTVTVTLNSNYVWKSTTASNVVVEGQVATFTYEITRLVLTADNVSVSPDVFYNTEEQKPEVTVKVGETTLDPTSDYSITYSKNDFTNIGSIIITVKGIGNYAGSVDKTYTIKPYEQDTTGIVTKYSATYGDSASEVVDLPANVTGGVWKLYNADKATLATTVGDATSEGEYRIFYARFESTNSNYASTGFIKIEISIAKADSVVDIEAIDGFHFTETYNGGDYLATVKEAVLAKVTTDGAVSWSGVEVIRNVGEYELTLIIANGINYNGTTVTIKVKITPATLTGALAGSLTYTGSEQTQGVNITGVNGAKLTEWNEATKTGDYKITGNKATNAVKSSGEAITYEITVTGVGNYAGSTWTTTYTVAVKSVVAPAWMEGTKLGYTFGETFEAPKPTDSSDKYYYTVTDPEAGTNVGTYTYVVSLNSAHGANVKWAEGTVVNANSQVELSYVINKAPVEAPTVGDLTFNNEIRIPTVTVDDTIISVTNAGGKEVGKYSVVLVLNSENHEWNRATLPANATIGEDGKTVTITYNINPLDITSNAVTRDHDYKNLTYTGVAYGNLLKVSLGFTDLVFGEDYTVAITRNDYEEDSITNAGDYVLLVTGIGNYTGSYRVRFTIAKAKAEISGITIGDYGTDESIKYIGREISLESIVNMGSAIVTIDGNVMSNPSFSYSYQYSRFGSNNKTTTDKILNAGTYVLTISLDSENYYGTLTGIQIQVARVKADDVLNNRLGDTATTIYYEGLLASLVNDSSLTWDITTDFSAGTAKFVAIVPEGNPNYIGGTFTVTKNMKFFTVARVGGMTGTPYGTVEAALQAASSTTVWVMPLANIKAQIPSGYTSAEGSITITTNTTVKSGVTLILPYDNSGTRNEDGKSDGLFGSTLAGESFCQTKLIIDKGVKVTVYGTLEVNGLISGGSSSADYSGATTGNHAVLAIRDNAQLVCESGGTIKASGYIVADYSENYTPTDDNPSIHIKDGGVIYQPFILRDFGGGSYMYAMGKTSYSKGKYGLSSQSIMDGLHMTPFNEYSFYNVQPFMRVDSKGYINIWANLDTSQQLGGLIGGPQHTSATFVGPSSSNAFLKMNDGGYMTSWIRNPETEVVDVNLYGGASIGEFKLTIKVLYTDASATTKNVFFALCWSLNVTLNDGTYDLGTQRMKLLWGAKLTVAEDATLNASNSQLMVHSKADLDAIDAEKAYSAGQPSEYAYKGSSIARYYGQYNSKNKDKISVDAQLIVKGTLIVKDIGGKVTAGAPGASIVVTNKASCTTYETVAFNADTTSSTVTDIYQIVKNLELVNADGSLSAISIGDRPMFYDGEKWTYGIKLDTDWGDDIVISTDAVAGSEYTVPNLSDYDPDRNYYTFDQWYLDQGYISSYSGSQTIPTGYVVKVYAKWTPTNYDIVYDSVIDGEYEKPTLPENGSFNIESGNITPPAVAADGLTLLGIFLDEDCTIPVTTISSTELLEYLVDAEFGDGKVVVFYYKWTKETKYSITFDQNVSNVVTLPGKIDDVWNNIPTYDLYDYSENNNNEEFQYEFKGWQVVINGSAVTDDEGNIIYVKTMAEVQALMTKDVTTSVTLRANWEIKYKLMIKSQGSIDRDLTYWLNADQLKNASRYLASDAMLLYNYDVKATHYFGGWDVEDISADKFNANKELTVTAQWLPKVKITVNITCQANSNVDSGTNKNVKYTFKVYDSSVTDVSGAKEYYNSGIIDELESKTIYYYVIPGDKYIFSDPSGSDVSKLPTILKTADTDIQYDVKSEKGTKTNSGGGSCIAAGTLITLADGTVKVVEDILETDILLVYDHVTGEYVPSSIIFIERDGWDYYNVIYLEYSNGVVNRLIYEHAMFDLTLNTYVYITEDNYQDYIGHEFAYFNGESIESVTLENAYVKNEYTGCYSLVTAVHLNYFIDGMFSIPGGISGIFNIFEYGEDLKFDAEKMQADIDAYGLFTYEDFAEYVPEEVFYAFQAQYFKVSIAKGYITFDEILAMIDKYLVKNGVI